MSRTVSTVLIAELSEKWWDSLTSKYNFICRKCSQPFSDRVGLQKHKVSHLRALQNVYRRKVVNDGSDSETIKAARKTTSLRNDTLGVIPPSAASSGSGSILRKRNVPIAGRYQIAAMKQISVLQGDRTYPTNPPGQSWSPKILQREQMIFKKLETSKFPWAIMNRRNQRAKSHSKIATDKDKGNENKSETSQVISNLPIEIPSVPNEHNNNQYVLSTTRTSSEVDQAHISKSIRNTEVVESSDAILYLLQSPQPLSPNSRGNGKTDAVFENVLNSSDQFTDLDDSFQLVLIEHEEVEFVDIDILSECNQEAIVIQLVTQVVNQPTEAPTPVEVETSPDVGTVLPTLTSSLKVATVCGSDLDLGANETIGLEAEKPRFQETNMPNSVETRKRNKANTLLRSVLDKTLLIRLRKCDDHYSMLKDRQAGGKEAMKIVESVPEIGPVLPNPCLTFEEKEPTINQHQEKGGVSLKRSHSVSALTEEWSVDSRQDSLEPLKLKIKRRCTSLMDNQKMVDISQNDQGLRPLVNELENHDQNKYPTTNESSSCQQTTPASTSLQTSQTSDVISDLLEEKCLEQVSLSVPNVTPKKPQDQLRNSLGALIDFGVSETLQNARKVSHFLDYSKPKSIESIHPLVPDEHLSKDNGHRSPRNKMANTDEIPEDNDQFSEAVDELCKSLVSDRNEDKDNPIKTSTTIEKQSESQQLLEIKDLDKQQIFQPSRKSNSEPEVKMPLSLDNNNMGDCPKILNPTELSESQIKEASRPEVLLESNISEDILLIKQQVNAIISEIEDLENYSLNNGKVDHIKKTILAGTEDQEIKRTTGEAKLLMISKFAHLRLPELNRLQNIQEMKAIQISTNPESKAMNRKSTIASMDYNHVQEKMSTRYQIKLADEYKTKMASTTSVSKSDEITKHLASEENEGSQPSNPPLQSQTLEKTKSELPETLISKPIDPGTASEYECKECSDKFQNARHLRHHEKTHTSSQKRTYEMDNGFIDIDCAVLREIEQMNKCRYKPSRQSVSAYTYSKLNVNSLCRKSSSQNDSINKDEECKLPNSQQKLEKCAPNIEFKREPELCLDDELISNLKGFKTTFKDEDEHKLVEDLVPPEVTKTEASKPLKRGQITKTKSVEVNCLNSNGVGFFEGFCKICGLVCNFESSTTHYLNKSTSQPYSCLTCEGKFNESDWTDHNLVCFAEEEFVAGYRILSDADGELVNNEAIFGLKKKRDFICCQCFIVMSGP